MRLLNALLWKQRGARVFTGLAIGLIALVVAACGSSASGSSNGTSGQPTPTATSAASGGATATPMPTQTAGSAPTVAPTPTQASMAPPFFFTVRATASNSTFDYTIIDNVTSNGDSHLALFVTADWNPGGGSGVYDNHPLGVYYIGSPTNKWAIFHEDKAAYTLNATYNVWVRETTQPGTIVWRASSAFSSGDYTLIDNPASNGNPNVVMLVTPNWNPGGVTGIYDPHPLGVFYLSGPNKWAIFHQDLAPFILNAQYNVYIAGANGSTKFVQGVCGAQCTSDYGVIGGSVTAGKPHAIVFVAANWNPGNGAGVYDNHNLGVWYTGSRWAIFHQDMASYTPNASYNVMIPQPGE